MQHDADHYSVNGRVTFNSNLGKLTIVDAMGQTHNLDNLLNLYAGENVEINISVKVGSK